MISSAYASYLLSEHWDSLKRRLFLARGRACEVCRSGCDVDAHHLVYRTPLTDGRIEDLMPLCRRCHTLATPVAREFRSVTDRDVWEIRRLTWQYLSARLGMTKWTGRFRHTIADFCRQFGLEHPTGKRPTVVSLNRTVLRPPAGRRRWVQYVPGTPKSPWD